MHVCAVAAILKLLHFISQLVFQGVVEGSLVFAEVAPYNGDGFWWKIENTDPVDGVVL